jgi:hypothetical protein
MVFEQQKLGRYLKNKPFDKFINKTETGAGVYSNSPNNKL